MCIQLFIGQYVLQNCQQLSLKWCKENCFGCQNMCLFYNKLNFSQKLEKLSNQIKTLNLHKSTEVSNLIINISLGVSYFFHRVPRVQKERLTSIDLHK